MRRRSALILLFAAVNILVRVLMANVLCETCPTPHEDPTGGKFVFERAIDDVGIVTEESTSFYVVSESVARNVNTFCSRAQREMAHPVSAALLPAIANICKTSAKPHTLFYIFALHRMRN